MKFSPRAAIFAVVTFCAGALATATTPGFALETQDTPVPVAINPVNLQKVPTAQETKALKALFAPQVAPAPAQADEAAEFATLSAAVDAQDPAHAPDEELNCLAIGVYYEAKGEPLAGQLAVAEVILNRAQSGRFPRSVCSVLTQRGQFSFVRGGRLPAPPAGNAWAKAVAVAQVARKDLWESPVPDALYFHARYVKPSWRRARVGTVGNHVFYR